jgi:hypothetical protein
MENKLNTSPITIRFRKWPGPVGEEQHFFRKLFEIVTGRSVVFVDSELSNVDIEIESVYGERQIPSLNSRLYRFLNSHLPGGIDFSKRSHTPNQQPTGTGRIKIFYTGENERPPEGRWDAYLSFDMHSFDGRNAYLPLWWITSSDILVPTISPYLGRPITIDQMLTPRNPSLEGRKKFCVAFIGKAYPFRMHAISAISKIGKVDVFGGIARDTRQTRAEEKFEISQNYKFVFAFENDLYPGYVTEKVPEAWATGAVPLYWGSDPAGYLNRKSFINLADFPTLEDFIERVREVDQNDELWSQYALEPLLIKRPSMDRVIEVLKVACEPLRR